MGQGVPVIVIAVVFDALRIFLKCSGFWASLGRCVMYCGGSAVYHQQLLVSWKQNSCCCMLPRRWRGRLFRIPALILFGNVMAIAIGLFGWLTIGLVLITNARIFTEHASHKLWLVAFSSTKFNYRFITRVHRYDRKMYHAQIKTIKTLEKLREMAMIRSCSTSATIY